MAWVLAGGLVGGCQTPRGFNSPDPNLRLDAIVEAAEDRGAASGGGAGSGLGAAGVDRASAVELIRQLESNDPAARLFAIRTLEALTGETLGYDYAGHPWERSEAVARWTAWLGGLPDPAASAAGASAGPMSGSGGTGAGG